MFQRNASTHFHDSKADSKEEITVLYALTKQLREYEQAFNADGAPPHMKPVWEAQINKLKKIIEDLTKEKPVHADSNEQESTNTPAPKNDGAL